MKFTKAEYVKRAYDAADVWGDNMNSEGCYRVAVETAHVLDGIEIANSNDGNDTISFTPTRTFKFDDSSSAYVSYDGVITYTPNEPY